MNKDVLRIGIFVAVVAALYFVVPVDELKTLLDVEALRAKAAAGGDTVLFAFLGGVVVLSILTAQMALPTIAGAALFGPVAGPLLAVSGVAIGGLIQFFVARYGLRGPAERILLQRVPVLRDAIDERGLALLVFLRFIWFPGFLINLGCAISRMPLRHFLVGFPAALPQAVLVAVVTDAVVTFGWSGIPLDRWLVIVGVTAGSLGLYVAAVRRWPHLKAIKGMKPTPSEEA